MLIAGHLEYVLRYKCCLLHKSGALTHSAGDGMALSFRQRIPL